LNIPVGFAYCDGSNGTPDLRGRTFVGSGNWNDSYGSTTYILGSYGGERLHQLTIAEMPSHNHFVTGHWLGGNGQQISLGVYASTKIYPMTGPLPNGNTLRNSSDYIGGNQSHNIMQPYVVVHYIMKL